MFATELALKGINIRANSIAPGVYASEMTQAQVTDVETVQAISQALVPVPAARAGT
jgi:NAD(P)-dependent dehydrogenase (short-subunit alcohol dehydrogenase family)